MVGKFYETVSRNHGHLLEVFADSEKTGIFRDLADADKWLGFPANNDRRQSVYIRRKRGSGHSKK